jgi:prepilin-type N-terminal cleavage/methylation domain-containing protein
MNTTWVKQQKLTSGFTIVELLIVIVVIGILAAITIVAYNGISNRSKDSAAEAAASNVAKKAAVYQSETGALPLLSSNLTSAAQTESYYLTGVTFVASLSAAPTSPSTVVFRKCGSGSPATQAAVTATNLTGLQMVYWDHTAGNANSNVPVGTTSGGTVACPTS